MKNILILIIILLTACDEASTTFEKVSCVKDGQSYRVFKPCREYIYNAKFWDIEHNLISESKIWMMATGKPWGMQPDKQAEIVIQYEFDANDIDRINEKNINKTLDLSWMDITNTGIIESKDEVWMHPFRQNQYTFTEVAPFPEVRTPLEIGKEWEAKMNISGWGDWGNSTVKSYYEVIAYETIELPYKKLDAWHISSYTEAPFGISTHNFWFHPALGFVKMIIKNYAGQILQIELIDTIEG